MSVKVEDRPLETVKDEVTDILIHNYSHGFISHEAFERRLDAVISATTTVEMMEQVKDLDQKPDEAISKSKEHQFSVSYSNESTEESTSLVSIMGGTDLGGQWSVPKVIRSFSFWGGSKIDFTDAKFSSPNVTIKCIAIMGGDEILIPEGVNVVTKAFCVMGGIDNKAPSIASKQAPTITIEGFVLMGGLDIKLKKTLKEKMMSFAEQMRAMFDSDKMY